MEKTPRIIEQLQTPKGQEVFQAALDSWAEKPDLMLAYERAVNAAKNNGMLIHLQVAIGLDLLEYGPVIVRLVQSALGSFLQPKDKK